MDKKVLLMILDGWGEGRHDRSNAIYTQGTPNLDKLRAQYPVSFLKACGEEAAGPCTSSDCAPTAESTAPWHTSTSSSRWPHSISCPRYMSTASWTAATATPAAARAS